MKKIFIFLALAACYATLWAVQAWRSPITVTQSDGTKLTIILQGDEHHHLQTTTDGYAVMQDNAGAWRYATLAADGSWSTEGAPVAHDLKQRKTAEVSYLSAVSKLQLSDVVARHLQNMTPEAKMRARIAQAPKHVREEAVPVNQMRSGNFPVKDSINAVVLLAEFSDKTFTYGLDYYERMMNEPGFCDDGEIGSVRDYYLTQSNGQFRPHFDVFGPIKLLHSARYYGANDIHGSDNNSHILIKEASELAADKYGCDFSKYDNDGDGEVDMVFVIFPGYGEHAGGGEDCIWPHKYQLSGYDFEVVRNGVKVNVYACAAELWLNTGTQSSSIGTFCHEFSHVLGLADHYNTQDATIYNFGYHDVMDYGNYNDDGRRPVSYSAFERASLGWMELEELDEPQNDIVMQDLKKGGKAYRLSTPNPNEFFVLENRQKSGFDEYMPDEGLMITHVDYQQLAWTKNIVNDDTSHPRYVLCPADGKLSYNNAGSDLFPIFNHYSFTDKTTPGSLTWDGQKTDRWVSNIRINKDEDLITFNYMANYLVTPQVNTAQSITPTGFTASWNHVEGATAYNLHLLKYCQTAEMKEALEENFDAFVDGSYSSPDAVDISSDLDGYTQQQGWQGESVYQAGGSAKLGSVNVNGWLMTPELDFSRYDGVYTIIVDVRSYTGKTPVFTVTAGGNTAKHRLSDKEKTYKYLFQGGSESTSIKFEVQKERAYINSIKIVRGDAQEEYPDAQPVSVTYQAVAGSPKKAQTDSDIDLTGYEPIEVQEVSDLTDTSYTFTDLEENAIYGYYVVASAANKGSRPSSTVVVNLSDAAGIEVIANDNASSARKSAACYDLMGRRMSQPRGIYISQGRLYVKK